MSRLPLEEHEFPFCRAFDGIGSRVDQCNAWRNIGGEVNDGESVRRFEAEHPLFLSISGLDLEVHASDGDGCRELDGDAIAREPGLDASKELIGDFADPVEGADVDASKAGAGEEGGFGRGDEDGAPELTAGESDDAGNVGNASRVGGLGGCKGDVVAGEQLNACVPNAVFNDLSLVGVHVDAWGVMGAFVRTPLASTRITAGFTPTFETVARANARRLCPSR